MIPEPRNLPLELSAAAESRTLTDTTPLLWWHCRVALALYRSAVQKGDRGSTATHLVPCLTTLTQRHNRNHSRKKNKTRNRKKNIKIMDLNVEFCDETHVIEVALADTVEDMRRKVASAVGLSEDSFFDMSFGDEAMGEGADMTQLSAGDTILVKKSMKQQAIAALHALGETDLTPERLKKVKNPVVARLLLQAEVTTVIPEGFLSETSLTHPFGFLHQGSRVRLDLSAVSTVTRIECSFLLGCKGLTSLDLSSFNSLTHVGKDFIKWCTSLTSLDLSSLNSLTHVGNDFAKGCTSLTYVDLSSSNSLTHVGDGFLQDCTSLTSLDLSSSNSLTHVGNGFLQDCDSLTFLDLSSLKSLTHVGYSFLRQCTSLTAVDLSSSNSLTHVGGGFLHNCASLTAIDLSSLKNVAHIGQRPFRECTSLETIHLSGCSAVVSRAVENANLMKFVVDARPKRKRDESPEEDCKRVRLSQ